MEALKTYDEALNRYPAFAPAYAGRAQLLGRDERWGEAKSTLLDYLGKAENQDLRNLLGDLCAFATQKRRSLGNSRTARGSLLMVRLMPSHS